MKSGKLFIQWTSNLLYIWLYLWLALRLSFITLNNNHPCDGKTD